MQLKEDHYESVTKHLSVAARQRQAAQATVLQSLGAAVLLPLHVLAITMVSVVKCIWSTILFLSFLLPPLLQTPMCVVVGAMLLYATYLERISVQQAAGAGICISVLVLVPTAVRIVMARFRNQDSVLCAASLFLCQIQGPNAYTHLCERIQAYTHSV